MSSKTAEIQAMTDEDELHKMMQASEDFDVRREIRQRMKQLREEKTAEWEKTRAEREACQTDIIALRQQQAKEQKEREVKALEEKAKTKREKTTSGVRDECIKKKQETAAKEKQEQLDKMKEMNHLMNELRGQESDKHLKDIVKTADASKAKKMEGASSETKTSKKTETNKDGSKTTTTTTTTTKKATDDGGTVTTQTKTVTAVGTLGDTDIVINKSAAEETARRIANVFNGHCLPETSGSVAVRTESWSSRDGLSEQDESSKSWGGAESARNAFQQLDIESGGGGSPKLQRSPSNIKQALLDWCVCMTIGYEHVNIKNFSSSWNDGMAFCALIHHFYPRAFNYSKLNPKCRRGNFKLAFDVSDKLGGIAPLLDVEDMVKMKNPDWKCVFCYVQQFYKRFQNWEQECAEKEAAALKAKAEEAKAAEEAK